MAFDPKNSSMPTKSMAAREDSHPARGRRAVLGALLRSACAKDDTQISPTDRVGSTTHGHSLTPSPTPPERVGGTRVRRRRHHRCNHKALRTDRPAPPPQHPLHAVCGVRACVGGSTSSSSLSIQFETSRRRVLFTALFNNKSVFTDLFCIESESGFAFIDC